MYTTRGTLEILQMANDKEPKSFKDFAKISIDGKKLSSSTISKRLRALTAAMATEEVIIKSKCGRRVIAHRTTEKGKRVIELSKGLDALLDSTTVTY